MLFNGSFASQASGSLGGITASHNKGGQYFRARAIPTNPNTARQQAVRGAFGSLPAAWGELDDAQRASWVGYAAETPGLNALGQSIELSGFNWFLGVNSFRTGVLGLGVLDVAPATPGGISLGSVEELSISIDLGVANLTGNVVGADDWAGDPAAGLAVFMGPSLSPGRQGFRGPYTLVAASVNQAVPLVISIDQANRYGPALIGQRRPVRLRAQAANGKLSNVFEAIVTVGEA